MRVLWVRFLFLMLLGVFQFFPSSAHAQVSCGAVSAQQTFPGGYWVQRTCNGRIISGVGTTYSQAVTNLNGFVALAPSKYCHVDNSSSGSAFPGGFLTSFQCINSTGFGYFVAGVGSTATDSGINSLNLAQLYVATNDIACHINEYDISSFVGGYKTTSQCNRKAGYANAVISGIGSTVTDLGANFRGFAELAASGNSCVMANPVEQSGLLFKAFFQCTKGVVTGYGSTVTEAGEDALMQASWM